jgi:hypothetical protein
MLYGLTDYVWVGGEVKGWFSVAPINQHWSNYVPKHSSVLLTPKHHKSCILIPSYITFYSAEDVRNKFMFRITTWWRCAHMKVMNYLIITLAPHRTHSFTKWSGRNYRMLRNIVSQQHPANTELYLLLLPDCSVRLREDHLTCARAHLQNTIPMRFTRQSNCYTASTGRQVSTVQWCRSKKQRSVPPTSPVVIISTVYIGGD